MHVLTVLDHPDPASLSAAVARHFMDGAAAAGHSTELADLNAEGFDPRWTLSDSTANDGGEPPADVQREQLRIALADAIGLVFPLFWWGMPSVMKGWVDRVWHWGWAYDQLDDPEASLQRPRTGVLLTLAGARSDMMESEGYQAAMETAWMQGTFGYFGFTKRRLEVLNGSTGSEPRRNALLDRAYQAGFTLERP
jgi:NAD(P)H dehydrogenase (quinone)